MGTNLCVRDAVSQDMEALVRLRPSPGLHRDRLRDASPATMRYLVLERENQLIGFACLVFVRPATWPDANDA